MILDIRSTFHKESSNEYWWLLTQRSGFNPQSFQVHLHVVDRNYSLEGYNKNDYSLEGYNKNDYSLEGYNKDDYSLEGYHKDAS